MEDTEVLKEIGVMAETISEIAEKLTDLANKF